LGGTHYDIFVYKNFFRSQNTNTVAVLRGDSCTFGLKIMPPSPRQHEHGVSKHNLPFTTIFISALKNSFGFFHDPAFSLSRFGFFTAYQNQA